ncbi:MAG: hypothetical protein NTU62_07855 [Spirochaetes bacterium]|nr:hypothetical protein [Spirochaetota bacterium]
MAIPRAAALARKPKATTRLQLIRRRLPISSASAGERRMSEFINFSSLNAIEEAVGWLAVQDYRL